MPFWLAEQFAHAWDAGKIRNSLNVDEDDWIRFVGDYTDVYVRLLNNELKMSTPASTHFLIIKMGSIREVVRFLLELEITLQTNQYKHKADVFSYDTYQFRAPCTTLKTYWEATRMPDVPRIAFDRDFELWVADEKKDNEDRVKADIRYPPALYPDVWEKPDYYSLD